MKYDKNLEATLSFEGSLSLEIAIPSEVAFADVPAGVSITRSKNNYIEFAATGRNWPIYVISVVTSVGVGVLSNYLYDAIKHGTAKEKPKTILIEREDVHFKRGEIERVIREKIEKKK